MYILGILYVLYVLYIMNQYWGRIITLNGCKCNAACILGFHVCAVNVCALFMISLPKKNRNAGKFCYTMKRLRG